MKQEKAKAKARREFRFEDYRSTPTAPSATGHWSDNPAEQAAFEAGRSLGRWETRHEVIAGLVILGNPFTALFIWAPLGGVVDDFVLGNGLDPFITAAFAVTACCATLGFLVHRRWRT